MADSGERWAYLQVRELGLPVEYLPGGSFDNPFTAIVNEELGDTIPEGQTGDEYLAAVSTQLYFLAAIGTATTLEFVEGLLGDNFRFFINHGLENAKPIEQDPSPEFQDRAMNALMDNHWLERVDAIGLAGKLTRRLASIESLRLAPEADLAELLKNLWIGNGLLHNMTKIFPVEQVQLTDDSIPVITNDQLLDLFGLTEQNSQTAEPQAELRNDETDELFADVYSPGEEPDAEAADQVRLTPQQIEEIRLNLLAQLGITAAPPSPITPVGEPQAINAPSDLPTVVDPTVDEPVVEAPKMPILLPEFSHFHRNRLAYHTSREAMTAGNEAKRLDTLVNDLFPNFRNAPSNLEALANLRIALQLLETLSGSSAKPVIFVHQRVIKTPNESGQMLHKELTPEQQMLLVDMALDITRPRILPSWSNTPNTNQLADIVFINGDKAIEEFKYSSRTTNYIVIGPNSLLDVVIGSNVDSIVKKSTGYTTLTDLLAREKVTRWSLVDDWLYEIKSKRPRQN